MTRHPSAPGDRTRSMAAAIPAGVLATVVMDAAMLTAARVGGEACSSPRLGIDVIGRWASGLARGRWRQDDASLKPAAPSDAVIGMATHYATGIALTGVFLLLPRRASTAGFVGAVGYGIATAILPLLVMFPSLGYGWLGLRSGEAARLARVMLIGHTAFGVGIGLGVRRFAGRRPR